MTRRAIKRLPPGAVKDALWNVKASPHGQILSRRKQLVRVVMEQLKQEKRDARV